MFFFCEWSLIEMWNGVKIIFISEISMLIIEKMFLNFIYLGTYIINL